MARHPLQRPVPLTMIWDAIWLTVLWFTLTGLRIWIREVWTLDLIAGNPILEEVEFRTHAPLVIPIVVCWVLWLYRLGAYRVLAGLDLRRLIGASALALCTLLALLFSVQATDVLSRSLYFGFALASGPVLWAERRVLMWLQKTGILPSSSQRILLVGDTKESRAYRQLLAADPPQGIEVIQDVVAHPDPLQTQSLHRLSQALDVQVVDHVLVGPGWTDKSLRMVARTCEEVGRPFSVDANFLGLYRSRPHLSTFHNRGLLSFSTTPNDGALAVKRVIDIVFSFFLLLICAPVMGLIALGIRLFDKGPVVFSQTRVGQNGRCFTFYKFRSMIQDAEQQGESLAHLNEMSGPVFKIKEDPRITPIGRLLRRTSMDELPQLWNVLRGEMSLVGPRPPLPTEVARYERWQLRRLSMKPGLTCIWQVSGRSEVDFESWMRQDLEYIDNWSLSLDFKLLVQTVPAVLSGSGAH